MSFKAFLEGAGGLKDTPAGRNKYEQYLDWLHEDENAHKDAGFERMSRGWANGTKDFKMALIADERNRLSAIATGDKDYADIREKVWESELKRCVKILGKKRKEIETDRKAADWKVP